MKRVLLSLLGFLGFMKPHHALSFLDDPLVEGHGVWSYKDLRTDARAKDPRHEGRSDLYGASYPKMTIVHTYNHVPFETPFSATLPETVDPKKGVKNLLSPNSDKYFSFVVQGIEEGAQSQYSLKPQYLIHPAAPKVHNDAATKMELAHQVVWSVVPGTEGQIEPVQGPGIHQEGVSSHPDENGFMILSGDSMHLKGITSDKSRDAYDFVSFQDRGKEKNAITYRWLLAKPDLEDFKTVLQGANTFRQLINGLHHVHKFDSLLAELSKYIGLAPRGEDEERIPQGFKLDRDLNTINWGTYNATTDFKKETDGSQTLRTNAAGAYQAMELIPLNNTKVVRIPYNVDVKKGSISIGVLTHDQQNWLRNLSFPLGHHEGVLEVPTEGQNQVYLVLQNNLAGKDISEVTLNKLRVLLEEKEEERIPEGFKLDRDLNNINWGTYNAITDFKKETDGSQTLKTNAAGAYQTMELIPLNNTKSVRIPYDLNVTKGSVSIGLLSQDQGVWLGNHSFPVGSYKGVLEFPTEGQKQVFLTLQNNLAGTDTSELTLNKLRVLVEKKKETESQSSLTSKDFISAALTNDNLWAELEKLEKKETQLCDEKWDLLRKDEKTLPLSRLYSNKKGIIYNVYSIAQTIKTCNRWLSQYPNDRKAIYVREKAEKELPQHIKSLEDLNSQILKEEEKVEKEKQTTSSLPQKKVPELMEDSRELFEKYFKGIDQLKFLFNNFVLFEQDLRTKLEVCRDSSNHYSQLGNDPLAKSYQVKGDILTDILELSRINLLPALRTTNGPSHETHGRLIRLLKQLDNVNEEIFKLQKAEGQNPASGKEEEETSSSFSQKELKELGSIAILREFILEAIANKASGDDRTAPQIAQAVVEEQDPQIWQNLTPRQKNYLLGKIDVEDEKKPSSNKNQTVNAPTLPGVTLNDARETNRAQIDYEGENYRTYNVSTFNMNCGFNTLDITREEAQQKLGHLRGRLGNKNEELERVWNTGSTIDNIILPYLGRYVLEANVRVFLGAPGFGVFLDADPQALGLYKPNWPTINVLNDGEGHFQILVPAAASEENNLLRQYGRKKEDLQMAGDERSNQLSHLEGRAYENAYAEITQSQFLNNGRGGWLKTYVDWMKDKNVPKSRNRD